MDIFANLAQGASVAVSLQNLLYAFIGALLGTLVGVLPGIGPLATIAMLLPLTFSLEPTGAIIMLAGIFYGAQYGGSTTAILVNLPGEVSSVVSCIDGHQMARRGRAGPALAIAALGSFFAGCVATFLIAFAAPALAAVALEFGPTEYFSLAFLGLVLATVLSNGPLIKTLAMTVLGLILGMIGLDSYSGTARFTFGIPHLSDGIDFVIIAMGMFGVAEIIGNLERSATQQRRLVARPTHLYPTREDLRRSWLPVLRGTGLGAFLGVLPGGGTILASFASYSLEKKISRRPDEFGQGAIEGLAAPEAANNAAAQTSFIPMLTLGIPSNAIMALMIGALMMHGILPGPRLLSDQPGLFWGLIVSMWVGNLMLVFLNLPLVGLWVRLLMVPYRFLFPAILIFISIGVLSLSNNTFDLILLAIFSAFGYLCTKIDCPPAPMILGFILGPMMEENLRRSLLMSRGDPSVLVTTPISAVVLAIAAAALLAVVAPSLRRRRNEVFSEVEP